MEDDDEFGDLYTDVLLPLSTTTASTPPPPLHPPIHPNPHSDDDDDDILFPLSNSKPSPSNQPIPKTLTLTLAPDLQHPPKNPNSSNPDFDPFTGSEPGDLKLRAENELGIDQNPLKDENFDIGDVGSDPIIPGLSTPPPIRSGGVDEADDWDSDSDDGLQIVLNDNNHGPMAMERNVEMGSDDEDEDGEPLVIVGDGDPDHQAMEEQDWGEDPTATADGERKEIGDGSKVGPMGGGAVVPKIGYSNHGYHSFHSQFKYVRPGAAPIPGAAPPIGPGGIPGQVRPPINMGLVAGRGRGDWRPMGMKIGTPAGRGYGVPSWGNNSAGRGFGVGLEFTLPSHKTIFDVDIDMFEEKPWRHPGIDMSDFFNFGLAEESWKDYCKQLEQLRMESTMQSRIRVYESGRAEQEYDPDLPPELAAASGIHDASNENANVGKGDMGQSDLTKGPTRVRPPLPTGRAIQVEVSYITDRQPSVESRPPRMRDADSVIEIVLQDSMDDDSPVENGALEQPDNGPTTGDTIEEDIAEGDPEYVDEFPQTYNDRKREAVARRVPLERDGRSPFSPGAPAQYRSSSRGPTSAHPTGNFGTSHEERWPKGKARERSPQGTPTRKEGSVESIDVIRNSPVSSPVGASRETSLEPDDVIHGQTVVDEREEMEGEEMALNAIPTDALNDANLPQSVKKQKLSSLVEQPVHEPPDDGEDLKAGRSSDNSKARSGSSRDYPKWRDGVDEEVIQDRHSTRVKRHVDEDELSLRGKERERNRVVGKGREDSYPYRDGEPSSAHHLHIKSEGFDRRKDRESSEVRFRPEDSRKRERGDEIGSRNRGKVRENDDKDEHLHPRKQLENGSWRGHHDKDPGSRNRERDDNPKSRYENFDDKDLGSRNRERDDNLKNRYENFDDKDLGSRNREREENPKSRYENADDLHSKRRKDEVYQKKDHGEKEEILHRRKRERDDKLDDRHLVRHKDEAWAQRERDEWHRLKTHEENALKREREGRATLRTGEKAWVGHGRTKDEYRSSEKEYQTKDVGRHTEQLKRRERVEDGYTRGNPVSNEDRRSRPERSSTRADRAPNASDNPRPNEKTHKENLRKSKEYEGELKTLGSSKRKHEDHSGQASEKFTSKGNNEQGNGKHDSLLHRRSSKKHQEDGSSDEEQQDSRRGRSKLERWTSHKERDYNLTTKSLSSLKAIKEIDRNHLSSRSSVPTKLDDSSKTADDLDNNQNPSPEEAEPKDSDAKQNEEHRHMDTVAKLKKRSERFKLPMPSEKEAIVIKKLESEPLPSTQAETSAPDAEVKHERPARKRRWVGNQM